MATAFPDENTGQFTSVYEEQLWDAFCGNQEKHNTLEDEFFRDILKNNILQIKEKYLLGLNAFTENRYGDPALHFAVLVNKVDIIKCFVSQFKEKDEINTIQRKNNSECGTALHTAMDGQVAIETLSVLLKAGADLNARDAKGGTGLHELIDMAWHAFEEEFANERKDCHSSNIGDSFLLKLDLLRDYNADMNCVHDVTGLTPLHKWCQQFVWCTERCTAEDKIPEWCTVFLGKLLRYGCDPKAIDHRGEAAIRYFAQRHYKPENTGYMGDYAVLCETLVNLSDLTQRNHNEITILHAAAEFSNLVLVENVLKYAASQMLDINVRDKFGMASVHRATHNITQDEVSFLVGIMDSLLAHGADINARDKHGSTPLHHAVYMENIPAIDWLLNHGADTSLKDNKGDDIYALALIEGDDQVRNRLGLLYHRDYEPVVSGVSDFRLGWFYPRCCHTQYSGESKGEEPPDIVTESGLEEYLKKYPPCIHNRTFVIQNCMQHYSFNKRQVEYTARDILAIHKELGVVMDRIACRLKEKNNLFGCEVFVGGSIAEGTKVGAWDEFDFVFVLTDLSQHVAAVESDDFPGGVVKLKPKPSFQPDAFSSSPMDNNGFVKRSVISNEFHKLLEKCLRERDIWDGTNFKSYAGTVDADGECLNIGQLHLIWYGPFKKRQQVEVDIVPVFKIPGWQTRQLREDACLLDKDVRDSWGCFIIMKATEDVTSQSASNNDIGDDDDDDDDDEEDKQEDTYFRGSFSQIEHAVLASLDDDIRNGYLIAKTILLQAPIVAVKQLRTSEGEITLPDNMACTYSVFDFITSYKLKTALLYALQDENYTVKINKDDLISSSHWNDNLLRHKTFHTKKGDLTKSFGWSIKIYRKLCFLVEANGAVPNYFLPSQIPAGISEHRPADAARMLAVFCRIMLTILEGFEIPRTLLTT